STGTRAPAAPKAVRRNPDPRARPARPRQGCVSAGGRVVSLRGLRFWSAGRDGRNVEFALQKRIAVVADQLELILARREVERRGNLGGIDHYELVGRDRIAILARVARSDQ